MGVSLRYHDSSRFLTFSILQRTQVQICVPGCSLGLCFMMLPHWVHFPPAGTVMIRLSLP
jgi:hypothetical protein